MSDGLTMNDALERWAEGPDLLEAALTGLAEAYLDYVDTEGGWSIREIVHHLADADAMWTAYLKVALISPGSRLSLSWHPGNKGIPML